MSSKFKKLAEYLTKLPGIGPRQATRLVLAMIGWNETELVELSKMIEQLKAGSLFCDRCFNFTDSTLCEICSSVKRDQTRIAVVEKVTDLESMEKTSAFNGVYHVLGGTVNPIEGNGLDKLKIEELKERIHSLQKLTTDIEVILATGSNTHGETTALYLEEELKPFNLKITRLARGLSSSSSIEYADEITLINALKHRR